MGVILGNPIDCNEGLEVKELILPEGWYTVCVESTSQQQSSNGNVNWLRVVFRISGGDFDLRLKAINFFIYDGSEKQMNYHRALLGKIALACGVEYLDDTGKIEGKLLKILFGQKPYNGEPQNTLKKFAPVEQPKTPKPEALKAAQVDDDDELPF